MRKVRIFFFIYAEIINPELKAYLERGEINLDVVNLRRAEASMIDICVFGYFYFIISF